MRIIFTQGIPASGKSTWAKEYCKENPNHVRVNRDTLREMIGSYKHKAKEKLIVKFRDALILEGLINNNNVIVDDTNLDNAKIKGIVAKFREVFPKLGYEIKRFDIELKDAIARDLARPNSVGSKVITDMYNKLYNKVRPEADRDETLPKAVIFDVDGTLARMVGRNPFDWQAVKEDEVKTEVADLARTLKAAGKKIVVVTGRDGSCLDLTKEWLDENNIPFDDIFIRPEGNMEKDSKIKRDIYYNNIKGKYFVEFVVDDRDQVVEMWREELGLTCLQVDYGNF